jgi:type I restriction enzyme S subunit
MTAWRECKLGDLLQIKHGFAFLGEYFAGAGTHVVLTPGNFLEEGGFKEKSDKAKWYNGPIPGDYVLNKGDLIVAMTEQAEGLLGSSALIPRSGVYLHNQRLGLVQIRDRKLADQNFLYYLFNSKSVRQQIRGSASGTKIRHTAPSRIADVKVCVPPLPAQRQIAGILTAYDELIENSQRRIRLTEAIARVLYREWFVHFRFPGHEKFARVASALGDIPQGWEVSALGEVATITMGLSPKGNTYNERGEGTPLVNGPVEFGERFTKQLKWTTAPTKLCGEGDLVVCVRGSTTGKYVKSDGVYCLGRGVCGLNSRYQCFVDQLFVNELPTLLGQTSGSTFPSWTGPQLKNHPVLCPPPELLARFEALIGPMSAAVLVHSRKIQNLQRTRDMLLPRLLSGEMELTS